MKVTVQELCEKFDLEVVAGKNGMNNLIVKPLLTRPGLELAGMFDFYESERTQIMGSKETAFFHWLNANDQDIRVRMIFEKLPPAIIFSNLSQIPDVFKKYGDIYNVPVLKSTKGTNSLVSEIYDYLSIRMAERRTLHGVLLDVLGVGVVIQGDSGIGKSEVALELVRRGYQLIADDRVDYFQREAGYILGEAPDILKRYLEIRGIGIVNVVDLFGVKAFRDTKRISLIVKLEDWSDKTEYDRLGLTIDHTTLFDTEVAYRVIPISEARNVATVVEAACMEFKSRLLGFNAAEEFCNNLSKQIKNNEGDK